MTIFLVRHAPTPSNLGGVFMGQRDVAPVEIEESEDLRIPLVRPRVVHSSPLRRALRAVELMFPDDEAIADPRLLERGLGVWEGLDHATVAARWPDDFVNGIIDPYAVPPGGESVEDVCVRISDFFDEIADESRDVYVMTHNGWIRTALMMNGGIGFDEIFADPVPFLTPMEFAPDWHLRRPSDH